MNEQKQTIWPYLTEFLPTKNTTVEKTRLEALFCISIGSHCCIKKKKIYIFKENQQSQYFTIFCNYKKEQMKTKSHIVLYH